MLYKYLVIVCLSTFPFISSLSGDFVFDDTEAIVNNKDVVSEAWTNAFYNDFWGNNIQSNLSHKSYRPLTILSYRINYILSGRNLIPLHFKITNLLCHMVCCILLFVVYQVILKKAGLHMNNSNTIDVGFLATTLFSVHPIHIEAVCGVVGRADILSAISFILSFIHYDKSIDNIRYTYLFLLTSIILAGIAMLFKENGITVLGYCVVYHIVVKYGYLKEKNIVLKKTHLMKSFSIKTLAKMIIISLASVFLLYSRWLIMGEMKPEFKPMENPAAFATNLFTKVVTLNYIYFLNFLLLVWPQWLCYDWSMGCVPLIKSVFDYRILFIFLIYLFAILHVKALVNPRNKAASKRLTILAVSLLVIPFLPAANILFPVGFVIAERILYLPSAGYCLLVAIGFSKLFCNPKTKLYKVGIAAYVLLIIIYSLRSWQRAFDWKTEYNLFISGLAVCPLNAKVHYNVAKVADARRNTTWALSEYKEAIRLYPEYYQALNNLGNLLKSQRQFNEAEFLLKKAIGIKEDFPAAWMNLGIVLAKMKRYNESQHAYKTALRYRRNYPNCLYNLGNLYLEMNKTTDAMESWLATVDLNPKHPFAWTNLIAMLDNTGQTENALQIIPRALAELPNTPSLMFVIANIYGKINEFSIAETYFKKAIDLFQNKVQPIHYANLGVLYHRWKKYDLAERMYKRALDINPKFKSAKKNLALLKK
ncbi:unnamed protein product [Parnassius apollo]|uniref:(apollo) hypothetical protein n=1 Tax=Parnassius apollo TaxID=110799 RepID=A0A8S3XE59_PARAO|nr:unnamed protein product [Parnassius apollo]